MAETKIPAARLALFGAAALAIVAVGVGVSRNRAADPAAPTPKASGSPQAEVGSMISGLEAKLKEKPDLIGGETWRDRDAKLLAQGLGIYVVHDKKGRLPRAQEVQALQVFQDGVRELAERIREADVNNAGNKGDVTE